MNIILIGRITCDVEGKGEGGGKGGGGVWVHKIKFVISAKLFENFQIC